MPTVAAIHGPCLGGGLEFVLACQHRIALDSSSTRLGLPEVQLGLIPGWGGTQRLPKLIGLVAALPMILQGKKLSASKARKVGLVDAVSNEASWNEFVTEFARDVSSKRPSAKGGFLRAVADSAPGRWFVLRTAQKKIARDAENYPALPAALRAVRAAFDKHRDGFTVEREEFARLIQTSTCRSLLNLFQWREQARSLDVMSQSESHVSAVDRLPTERRVSELTTQDSSLAEGATPTLRTVGVIGAGAMGAGIGQLAALKGFHVVLKELTPELADAGMKRVTGLLDDMVARKLLTSTERDGVLDRVTATDRFDDLADCDLVIEAVVEKMDVKQKVFAELDGLLKSHAIIVSNTSALSVTEMATATKRPDRVAGLHFFNPVHRMDLVEVVRTEGTSPETVATLLKLVKKLGKTPIVTSDSPGFLVNRVLFPYIGEAIRMVTEGHSCHALDREVKRFGMPMGPIELIDHVGLDVAWHVAATLENVLPESREVIGVLGQMVARGWTGRKGGRGFYEYNDGKRGAATDLTLVIDVGSRTSDLANASRQSEVTADDDGGHPSIGAFLPDGLTDVQRRLVYPMINEVGFCMQERVVAEPWMADLAMILGTGFAPFRGGPMTLADGIGQSTLQNNLHVLAARHGERFKSSAWLVDRRTNRPEAVGCAE